VARESEDIDELQSVQKPPTSCVKILGDFKWHVTLMVSDANDRMGATAWSRAKGDRGMRKLSPNGQKLLKCFYFLAAGIWVGTSVSLSAKQFFVTPTREGDLFGILSTFDFIDLYVFVPGASR
jgi:hypothetical protein